MCKQVLACLETCVNMNVSTCVNTSVNMCVNMCVNMRVNVYVVISVNMCVKNKKCFESPEMARIVFQFVVLPPRYWTPCCPSGF